MINKKEKNLIKEVGKKEVPGHPTLFGTTKDNINIKPVAQIPIQTEAVHLVAEEEKQMSR